MALGTACPKSLVYFYIASNSLIIKIPGQNFKKSINYVLFL